MVNMIPLLLQGRKRIAFHSHLSWFAAFSQKIPFCLFGSPVVPNPPHASRPTSTTNPLILNYLTETFGISETRAASFLKRKPQVQTLERPNSVVHVFKQFGLLDDDIKKAVRVCPQILFADAEKKLRPKLQFFQDIGFSGPEMGFFLSKGSVLLTHSLDKRLAPSVEILRRFLSTRDLLIVLRRCHWIIKEDPSLKLVPNISFLQSSCGIGRSQLSMLFVRQPSLFVRQPSALHKLVDQVVGMGVHMGSGMFVYALYTISCLSLKTLETKFELFHSYGFSREEMLQLFTKAPNLLRSSKEKLRSGLEFFLRDVGVVRSELARYPASLMYSMEKRVAPRYRVLQVLDSKGLGEKWAKLLTVMGISDEKFLKRYVWRYIDAAPELLGAYKLDAEVASSG